MSRDRFYGPREMAAASVAGLIAAVLYDVSKSLAPPLLDYGGRTVSFGLVAAVIAFLGGNVQSYLNHVTPNGRAHEQHPSHDTMARGAGAGLLTALLVPASLIVPEAKTFVPLGLIPAQFQVFEVLMTVANAVPLFAYVARKVDRYVIWAHMICYSVAAAVIADIALDRPYRLLWSAMNYMMICLITVTLGTYMLRRSTKERMVSVGRRVLKALSKPFKPLQRGT